MIFVPESTVTQRLSQTVFCMLPRVIGFLIKRLLNTNVCSVAAAFDMLLSRNTAGKGINSSSPLGKVKLVLLRTLTFYVSFYLVTLISRMRHE